MSHRDRRGSSGCGRALGRSVVPLLLLVIALLRLFVYRPVMVSQDSMLPTLHENDRLLVNTLVTRRRLPPRGAIVVIQHPTEPYWVVKRVVGLPGDSLDWGPRGLYINGQLAKEPYIKPWREELQVRVLVPEGTVYVAGDNRPSSEDSRDYGPVSHSLLIGEVVRLLWPWERARALPPADLGVPPSGTI